MIPPIIAWSFSDTRATQRYCVDPDITANQAHLQCQLDVLISLGVRVGGTITISRIPRHVAVVAAAAVYPTVKCIPVQLCLSQSLGSTGSQGSQ
jgi:hypothetical protein